MDTHTCKGAVGGVWFSELSLLWLCLGTSFGFCCAWCEWELIFTWSVYSHHLSASPGSGTSLCLTWEWHISLPHLGVAHLSASPGSGTPPASPQETDVLTPSFLLHFKLGVGLCQAILFSCSHLEMFLLALTNQRASGQSFSQSFRPELQAGQSCRQARAAGRPELQAGQSCRQARAAGRPELQAGQSCRQARAAGRPELQAGQSCRQARAAGRPELQAGQSCRQARAAGRPELQAGQSCRPRAAGQSCWPELQARAAGQSCWPELQAGQSCRPELQARAAGQSCRQARAAGPELQAQSC